MKRSLSGSGTSESKRKNPWETKRATSRVLSLRSGSSAADEVTSTPKTVRRRTRTSGRRSCIPPPPARAATARTGRAANRRATQRGRSRRGARCAVPRHVCLLTAAAVLRPGDDLRIERRISQVEDQHFLSLRHGEQVWQIALAWVNGGFERDALVPGAGVEPARPRARRF